ncbi:protein PFF0380w-like [Vespa velutina]|uniref:protein PFF0380w-like n=1 Tax=Vespa velutina TaxID=202808 RepID=UPI001FB353DE|nr:protein PFF0380w-like [Vespa velutina]
MAGRFRERQYQLAAEKRNEAYLRQSYYKETARYFERESGIAKHYDSWNLKLAADPRGKLEREAKRKKKLDQLPGRRNKLRILLNEEDEIYQRELAELIRKKKSQENDINSLEFLKKKLKEKRMEQDLYFPNTCRRLRSYFLDPRPISSSIISSNINNSNNNIINNNNNRSNNKSNNNSNGFAECFHLKDSTNLLKTNQEINRTNSTYKKNNMSNWNDQKDRYDNNIDLLARNRKYSARYARRSLENTNVRPGDDIFDNLSRRLQESMMTTTMSTVSSKMADDDKENLNVDVVDDSTTTTPVQTTTIDLIDQEDPTIIPQDVCDKDYSLNRTEQEITTNDIANDKQIIIDHCDYERERGYPWMRMDPNVKNLSEKMYLYLTYKELKEKIDDLLKKEEHACNRQRWDDAIRLRDMKNELELIREKKIFNMKSLTMDEDVRDRALKNIDDRERELALRVDACTDTTMYSDGAKVLWEKWIKEDDRFVIKDATTQREILIKELEEEFQNLAVEDRERIAKTYQSVFNNLHLENRHHLNTNLVAEAKSKSNATGGT